MIPHEFNLGRSCYAYYILIKLISFVSKRQHTLLYRTYKFIFVSHVHLYDTNVFNVLFIFYFKIYLYYDKNEYKMIIARYLSVFVGHLGHVSLSMNESFN